MQIIHIHPSPIPWYIRQLQEACTHPQTKMHIKSASVGCEEEHYTCTYCEKKVAIITDCG
ncbi:hypothetical protein [Flagellimonas eckloniae]|uniref:hypothetical protein n=1 Tax=Flagellimonas eckloniae TaxID=346185 RepID=UPI00111299E6|nr:hypothetical protein [Allomuricauda eckloniae]